VAELLLKSPALAWYINHLVPALILGGEHSSHQKILFKFLMTNGYLENGNC